MRSSLRIVATVICCLTAAVSVPAEKVELASANAEIQEIVDLYIDVQLKAAGVTPASQTDDANLLRRTMLDLVGRFRRPLKPMPLSVPATPASVRR